MNLIKLKNQKKSVDREKLIYDTDKYIYDFRKFKTIRTFGKDLYEGKISLKQADVEQSYLANEINNFIKGTRPKIWTKNNKEKLFGNNYMIFLMQDKWFLMDLKVKYF